MSDSPKAGVVLSVIDIGSNTINLLVGKVRDNVVIPIASESVHVQLGAGVDATGKMEPERMRAAVLVVALMDALARMHSALPPVSLATSAVRDAANGQDLLAAIRLCTPVEARLLPGDREATLGFRGATSTAGVAPDAPVLVVDIGGGSAQLSVGTSRSGPQQQVSLPLGSNRTTERSIANDPPTQEELQQVRTTPPPAAQVGPAGRHGDRRHRWVGAGARPARWPTFTAAELHALAAEIPSARPAHSRRCGESHRPEPG
ncbi:MAG: hypothetical protein WKH64_01400 [Chloroflexia bacterium]